MANHALTKKMQTKDFELLEGDNSYLFLNRKNTEVNVNGMKVKQREYLSKGVPIIYEGKRILN